MSGCTARKPHEPARDASRGKSGIAHCRDCIGSSVPPRLSTSVIGAQSSTTNCRLSRSDGRDHEILHAEVDAVGVRLDAASSRSIRRALESLRGGPSSRGALGGFVLCSRRCLKNTKLNSTMQGTVRCLFLESGTRSQYLY